jgi:hypothetical protein
MIKSFTKKAQSKATSPFAIVYTKEGKQELFEKKDWDSFSKNHLHRQEDDLPAATLKDGSKFWYKDGKRHRDKGPAVMLANGTEKWYQDGEFHREDGPAIIYPDKSTAFFIKGMELKDPKIERTSLVDQYKKECPPEVEQKFNDLVATKDLSSFKYSGPEKLWMQVANNAKSLEDTSLNGEVCVSPFGTGQKMFGEGGAGNIGYIWKGKPSHFFPFDVFSVPSETGNRTIDWDNIELNTNQQEAWLNPSKSKLVGLFYNTKYPNFKEFKQKDKEGVDFFEKNIAKKMFLRFPNKRIQEISEDILQDDREIEQNKLEQSLEKKSELLSKIAHKRWTEEEVDFLKSTLLNGKERGLLQKDLYKTIARRLRRTPREIEKKLSRLYSVDEELKATKQNNWSREKIIEELKKQYLSGAPFNKNALPDRLKFILLKVSYPTAPEHRQWFSSLDEALAETVLQCGFEREDNNPIQTLEQALNYVKLQHKKRHRWSLDEIKEILKLLHEKDYPITLPFLANHYDLYKDILKINRKLEGIKDIIKKFIVDGSITSYSDLICSIAPEYNDYYNKDKSRLRLSTEEIRVKKFLDRHKINYIIPRLSDKLPANYEGFANFVPDFVLLSNGKPVGIVEVFGSIGDRENANVKDLYADKTQNKITFYKSIPNIDFIDIWNNGGKCDLDDKSLQTKFNKFLNLHSFASKSHVEDLQDLIKIQATEGNWNYSPYMRGLANGLIISLSVLTGEEPIFFEEPEAYLEDLVTSSWKETQQNLNKFGISISHNDERSPKYAFIDKSGMLDVKFDSLLEIPKLTHTNKALKKLLDDFFERQKYRYVAPKTIEQHKDYHPRELPVPREIKNY